MEDVSTGFSLSQKGCTQTQYVLKSQETEMTGQSFKASCAYSASAGAASINAVLGRG